MKGLEEIKGMVKDLGGNKIKAMARDIGDINIKGMVRAKERKTVGWESARKLQVPCFVLFPSTKLALIVLCSLIFVFNKKFHFFQKNLSFSPGQILPNPGVEKLSTLDLCDSCLFGAALKA